MASEMSLDVWNSDFLLPSVDNKCLQFMLCARICAAPIKIVRSFSPRTSPTGEYPVFKHGSSKVITDFRQFLSHLKKQVPDLPIDGHLNAAQLAEISAYESFLEENLRPAYVHALWFDEYNWSCVTSRWFGKQLSFPYGLYFTYKMKNRARNYLRNICTGSFVDDAFVELSVTKRALRCINLLSSKLGDNKYFFGNRPSSLDAMIFGYLAPLLRLPLPNDRLSLHIKACPNLVRFVDSIINIYLPLTDYEITTQQESLKEWEKRKLATQNEIRMKSAKAKEEEKDSNEYPLRDKIIFGVTAAILSLCFAIHLGLIQVEVKKVNGGGDGVERSNKERPAIMFAQEQSSDF